MSDRPDIVPPGAPEVENVLSFDVVIATRNRPEALALSIPLILGQSRQPEKLIVVDSSQDHAPVADTVAQATQGWPGQVIVEHSGPGLPFQRNIGLAHVTADVVIFPDDDSLLYPGAAQAIMSIYERDKDAVVTGVCGVPAGRPPEGAIPDGSYTMSKELVREDRTRRWRNRIQTRFSALKPSLYLGQMLSNRHPVPDWIAADDRLSVVAHMTGFRMSFRSAAIKKTGFDDALQGYALSEDIDASLAVARHGLLIGARDAEIYHHRFPGGRGNGFNLGAIGILNRVYIALKHTSDAELSADETTGLRTRLRWFVHLSRLNALIRSRSEFGRDRRRGTFAAAAQIKGMLTASRADLADQYRKALEALGI